jgi:hypothetical protein
LSEKKIGNHNFASKQHLLKKVRASKANQILVFNKKNVDIFEKHFFLPLKNKGQQPLIDYFDTFIIFTFFSVM